MVVDKVPEPEMDFAESRWANNLLIMGRPSVVLLLFFFLED